MVSEDCYAILGVPREAQACFESALEIRKQLATDHPKIWAFQRELASTYQSLGLLFRRIGRHLNLKQNMSELSRFRSTSQEHEGTPGFANAAGATLHLWRLRSQRAKLAQARKRLRRPSCGNERPREWILRMIAIAIY